MELKFTIDAIRTAAAEFLGMMGSHKVIAFNGEMGAGKTTFIHALCDEMKVTSPVGSPTFSIINQYSYPGGVLYHLDLYRLKDEEEAIGAGVEDTLYSGSICFAEWPERAANLFPEDTLFIFIEILDEQTRRIRIADK